MKFLCSWNTKVEAASKAEAVAKAYEIFHKQPKDGWWVWIVKAMYGERMHSEVVLTVGADAGEGEFIKPLTDHDPGIELAPQDIPTHAVLMKPQDESGSSYPDIFECVAADEDEARLKALEWRPGAQIMQVRSNEVITDCALQDYAVGSDDDLEIDLVTSNAGMISHGDSGAWVRAWVWIPSYRFSGEPEETEEPEEELDDNG